MHKSIDLCVIRQYYDTININYNIKEKIYHPQMNSTCFRKNFMCQWRGIVFIGTFLSLKGAVLTFSCMDRTGGLMQPPYEVWRDPNNIDENEKSWRRKLVMNCPSPSQEIGDHQYTIICSEKQAKVFSLPSQTCLYVHNITETSFILQADVVVMCNSACLACFCANGHIMIMRYVLSL